MEVGDPGSFDLLKKTLRLGATSAYGYVPIALNVSLYALEMPNLIGIDVK